MTEPSKRFEPATLVELLQWRAQHQPEQTAYTFLLDGETLEARLTYADLDREARSIAARLQKLNAVGERVLLLYPPGLQFIAAFFGCLYAGAVAVPAYPPKRNRSLRRLGAIARDAQPAVALTTDEIAAGREAMRAQLPDLEGVRWLTDTGSDEATPWQAPEIDSTTLAFLQYTSGSTGDPKGVMLRHEQILANERMIQAGCGHDASSSFFGWLPLYHDMGLIGNVFQPLYVGIPCVLMSPVHFLQRPLRWLQGISRYRSTTSGAPNFAYELCLRRIRPEERTALDLSSWRVAFNGAEPIRPETLQRFAGAFEPQGFRRSAFFPCYGLAEATLIVSGARAQRVEYFERTSLEKDQPIEAAAGDVDARQLMSCGAALLDSEIAIVDPATQELCGADRVGEIWVRGPHVAAGYWGLNEESRATFEALPRGHQNGGFLRTGDLGFLREDELFVTGRLKDLIIIRGRNLYPQDVERTVEACHPALRPGAGAAFSVELDGEERLAVVHELGRPRPADLNEVLNAIRSAIAEEHEVQVAAIVLSPPATVPKTSSGKVERRSSKQAFLNDELRQLASWHAPRVVASDPELPTGESLEEIEGWLIAQLSAHLGQEIDPALPLTHYGLDSLLAVQLAHAATSAFGADVALEEWLESASLGQLASKLFARAGAPLLADRPAFEASTSPLSAGQQALWYLHRLAPESSAYHVAVAARFDELDAAAFRHALQRVVDRHPMLRASIRENAGEPELVFHRRVDARLEERDASSWSAERLQRFLVEASEEPFDLENDRSLSRFVRLRRSGEAGVLLLVVHHLIIDLWSLAIIVRDLESLYVAERSGQVGKLPVSPVHFGDLVRQEAEMLAGREGKRLERYWEQHLGGGLQALDLPTDRPRPAVQTFSGMTVAGRIHRELRDRAEASSRRRGVTLYMTLIATFEALLSRMSGQHDVFLGSPTAGRGPVDRAEVVGYLVNPVVLRGDLRDDPRAEEFLQRVRQDVLGAFGHRDLPFPRLVECLGATWDASRSALFQAMLVFQKAQVTAAPNLAAFALGQAGARLPFGDTAFESMELEHRAAQLDLTLVVAELDGGLALSLELNKDLFDPETGQRLLGHFETLLGGLTQEDDERISLLPWLTDAEQRQLLGEWGTREHEPCEVSLHGLIERQADRTPDRPAVVSEGQSWSYRELLQRTERLAAELQQRGVRPGRRVGVLMDRRPELIMALLAVLRAGGAYVPLDPAYPSQRLRFMIADAGLSWILTDANRTEELRRELTGIPSDGILAVDGADAVKRQATLQPVEEVPESLALVIYTSGSTGKPKGVAITHRSTVALARWARDNFSHEELSGVVASTSVCFDLSVFEIFVPLACGGTVLLARDALDLEALADAGDIRLLNTVPSTLAALLRQGQLPDGLKTVNLAGEALPEELVERTFDRVPSVQRMLNLYGPSEDTVYSTGAVLRPGGGKPPIGVPVGGARTYVLDCQLQPVPIGVPGELYLGGIGLARCYLERPALTGERFLPDPNGAARGARMYRTGDVVRWLPSGQLDYLGRNDQQVKVRGFRVELGEIEAVLRTFEGVRDAAVIVHGTRPEDRKIVAYTVSAGDASATGEDLRAATRERLPGPLVPSVFIALDEMPMTPNRKIDRKALPAPDRGASGAAFVAPRNPTEVTLCGICAELLGLEKIGVHDSFFALGGHSLLAARLASKIREVFDVELSLRRLLQAPTVAELADQIGERGQQSSEARRMPEIVPLSRQGRQISLTADGELELPEALIEELR
ncbi:MAG: amino acid adenylation domain-containing protein [Acidobacteriota bacterium]